MGVVSRKIYDIHTRHDMFTDTRAANKLMDRFDNHEYVWLSDYGPLSFRPDFPYLKRRPTSI